MLETVVKPFHEPLTLGRWWACEFPERPWSDSATMGNRRCKACLIAAQVASINGQAHKDAVLRDSDGGLGTEFGSFAELIQRCLDTLDEIPKFRP